MGHRAKGQPLYVTPGEYRVKGIVQGPISDCISEVTMIEYKRRIH